MKTVFCLFALAFITGAPVYAGNGTQDGDITALLRSVALDMGKPGNLDTLIRRSGQHDLVLLGEASHGTSEFYLVRADISQRLIEKKGFNFIAVEGDWGAMYLLNRYVKLSDTVSTDARPVMQSFDRWPVWMWANNEVLNLIEWLRVYNAGQKPENRVGFYGIDVYGAESSLRELMEMLQKMPPSLRAGLSACYACLEPYADDFGGYARAVASGASPCDRELQKAISLLKERRRETGLQEQEYFNLKQHARVVKKAARHYHAMIHRGPDSWNHRADHFFSTVSMLLERHGPGAKGVVWAHNTHIGDARATTMSGQGKRNIGQIAREQLGEDRVYAVGFGTNRGTVMAARNWGGTPLVMNVPAGMQGSYEDLMHRLGMERALFMLEYLNEDHALQSPRGHRAIGVIYHPEHEAPRNYVPTLLTKRYNAFIFIEHTHALSPLR